MIVYKNTKEGFLDDVLTNDIANIILKNYKKTTGGKVGASEMQSWQNSLMYMNTVLSTPEIPENSGVSIEYHIPQSSKRVDFIISGQDEDGNENVVLVELKQWAEAEATEMDGVVRTRFKHGLTDTSHPSYQAWSYAALLKGFNATIYDEDISLRPCAYCHNYTPDGVLDGDQYSEHTAKAPLFLKPDALKLREFIKAYVKHGDSKDVLYRIENGEIRPSKVLADSLASMLKGNKEFVLIDDQKLVFEKALSIAKRSDANNKHVLIVEGGPGTGKSVVAINLLVELTKHGHVAKYITKNAAPRSVYEKKLTGVLKKTEISNLFSGSGSFIHTPPNTFNSLIVDEAHRLNERSGLFSNLGENQIMEIIKSSMFSIFFIDEDQRVTFKDIGQKEDIINWSRKLGAVVHEMELSSQFRCNGSDGYLAWLDHNLQIRDTANPVLDIEEFDLQIVDSLSELKSKIFEKNKINNKARMVAGYCWDWLSKKNPTEYDFYFPEEDFVHRWNLTKDGSLWIISPDSVNEVGCIHTCQGLEVDYVGVIIGPDMIARDGIVRTDAAQRSKMDQSIKGYKSWLKRDKEGAHHMADLVIKNTYRTLMTRGMKGCYLYFTDEATANYFKKMIKSQSI